MLNQVITLESNFSKSIGFDQHNLYVSHVQFSTITGLKDECGNSDRGSSQTIPLDSIQKITYTKDEKAITIYFLKQSNKKKSFYIEGFHPETALDFINSLAKAAGMDRSGGGEENKQDYTQKYLTLAGVVIFTVGFAWIANLPRTGHRKQLIKLLQDIGPAAICITGGIIVLIILFQIFKQSRQPANQIVFQKK